ncbi:hypothetical protein KW787_03560 [Candidatus Pacearchaeota archaeon]|nr:hypothetical protein [Candidatus Pacearchaeota archaeon]
MINTSNLDEARKKIKAENKPVIVKAQNDEFNRKILEYGKFDVLLSPESGERNDNQRQLDSGLNHVLAEIAAKNKVSIGIDLEEIRKMRKEKKAIRLARIIQNIRVCKKAGIPILPLNYKEYKDAQALLRFLESKSIYF